MGRYKGIFLTLLVLMMLTACASSQKSLFGPSSYTIKSYDTLYSIAWRYGLDVNELARWNRIQPPYKIYPGQRIILHPPVASTTVSQPTKSPATKPSHSAKKVVPIAPPSDRAANTASSAGLFRHWPTAGKVSVYFSNRAIDRKGIDIKGRFDQPVFAVSPGRVVYSGNGLADYGNLIIVKHTDTFLSAYAHNNKILVTEGTQVKTGQKIATMGKDREGDARLHFQIRRLGKPVNPLNYLPKKNNLAE